MKHEEEEQMGVDVYVQRAKAWQENRNTTHIHIPHKTTIAAAIISIIIISVVNIISIDISHRNGQPESMY